MEHTLKTINPYFQDVINYKKSFEVRKNDRDFKVNDRVILQEWENGKPTLHFAYVKITYVLQGGQFGIDKDYCVFGFVLLDNV